MIEMLSGDNNRFYLFLSFLCFSIIYYIINYFLLFISEITNGESTGIINQNLYFVMNLFEIY